MAVNNPKPANSEDQPLTVTAQLKSLPSGELAAPSFPGAPGSK